MTARPRVLLIYADHIGARMGGVGIRACELARALAPGADVTLAAAATDGSDVGVPVVTFLPHAPRALQSALATSDVVVAQPQWPLLMHRLAGGPARLIFDLYDPEVFGTLAHFAKRPAAVRSLMTAFAVDRLVQALRIGHHIACANERQRDLWLGALVGARLVDATRYDRDPSLRSVVDVVPYGVPREPPRPPVAGPRLRERFRLDPDAQIVLWNGGLWSWLDAETPIRAVARLRERRPQAHLIFMGAGTAPPAVRATERARALAAELGLLERGVHFNDGWVAYSDRAAWLLDADCAVSTHRDDVEARFASRTRILDCLWARLPVVCTAGDELADRIARDDLGVVVPPGDVEAAAAALAHVLDGGRVRYGERLAAAAAELAWDRVTEPLVRWVHEPAPPPARPGLVGGAAGERLRTAAYLLAARTLEGAGVTRLPSAR